jgi:hypothetical protein
VPAISYAGDVKSRTSSLVTWAAFATAYCFAYVIGGVAAGSACSSRSGTGCDIAAYWEPIDHSRAWGWLPFWGPLVGVIAINSILIILRQYRIALLVGAFALTWLLVQAVLAY